MQVRVAKYTSIRKPIYTPQFSLNMFQIRFDVDPGKYFKTDYFVIHTFEHNSLYGLVPSFDKDDEHRFKISFCDKQIGYPYFTTVSYKEFSDQIEDIKDFAMLDSVSEVTPSGIRFLLPSENERNEPRLRVTRKTTIDRIRKHQNQTINIKTERQVVKPVIERPVIERPSPITTPKKTSIDGVRNLVTKLNAAVSLLEEDGIDITLRLEGNLIKAKLNTDL